MIDHTTAVVIFGASGFVGRNLVNALDGKVETLIGVTNRTRVVPKCTKVVTIDEVSEIPKLPKQTVVINAAAFRYDASRLELAQSDILIHNTDIINKVFHFCAERNIKELRLSSSIAVYPMNLPLMDDSKPVDLNAAPNPHEIFYAWSKRYAETLAELYREKFGINTLTFRLSNPYGPYDSIQEERAHVAPAFVMKALNDKPIFTILGGPSVERDFVYVDDVVKIFLRSLNSRDKHETYNLCTGQSTSLLTLAESCLKITGASKQIVSGAPGAFGPTKRIATSERLQAAMPIEFTGLMDGLKHTIDWYKDALKL